MSAWGRRVFLLGALGGFSHENAIGADGDRTAGLLNGRSWLGADDARRTWLLAGYLDVAEFHVFLGTTTSRGELLPTWPPGLNIGDVTKELNLFYSEGANAFIPILSGLVYVAGKASGVTPQESLKFAAGLRKKWIDIIAEKQR